MHFEISLSKLFNNKKIIQKMKKRLLVFAITFLATGSTLFAQSGNIGIGTNAPTAKLHVAGNVRIADGTEGANKVFTSDATGTGTWQSPAAAPGALSGVYEVLGTGQQTMAANTTADINGATITITLTKASTLLITYSALGLPTNSSAPTQGTINLMVDGTQQISSYYSGQDAPNGGSGSTQLGNYSTSQKVITLGPGSHTIKLQAKCWNNSTTFNVDPFAVGYHGSLASDVNSMKARISVIVFNN
jgi:hypothetical protein